MSQEHEKLSALVKLRGDLPDSQIIIEADFARKVVDEYEALVRQKHADFDLENWMLAPSRDRPLAAAAAVNMRKGVQS